MNIGRGGVMPEFHLLDEVEPVRPDPGTLKGLHPLARKAVCIFGFQLSPSNGHDQYRWLWHQASVETRQAVLSELWKYSYVQDYLIGAGVITRSTTPSTGESLVGFAVRDYVELPEPIRFLTVYANGDGGLHQNHVREHGLFLLSQEALLGGISQPCRGTHTDTHPFVVNAGWAEN